MTPWRARIVGGLLVVRLACSAASAAPAVEMDTTSELIRLADVVGFLRRRVLAERPELLADREGQVAAFRVELARLDLDPPEGVPLDVRVDDLNLAGLLLEEQLRRRRSARRRSLVAETEAAFEVPSRPARVGDLPGDAAVVPEAAHLFSAVRGPPSKVPAGPHHATALAEELADVGSKLRAALARMDAVAPVSDDPRYGDRSHRVSGIEPGESLEETKPVATARVLPAPVARQPDLDTRHAAGSEARLPREEGVAAVLAQVLTLVQGGEVSPAEFPTVMSATLATFGVKVPGGFRPRPEDTPQAMARELLATSGGAVDVSLAAAALGM